MTLEWLGDVALVISVITTTLFVFGYALLAPFYRTAIGWSLLASKTWIMSICWYALFRTTLEVPDDSVGLAALRAFIWIMLPVISVTTFWALLVRGQVRSSRRRRAHHRVPGEGAQ